MSKRPGFPIFSLALVLAAAAFVSATSTAAQEVLPRPEATFQGQIADTREESTPAFFPQPVTAPKGAPNVVLTIARFATFPRAANRHNDPLTFPAYRAIIEALGT